MPSRTEKGGGDDAVDGGLAVEDADVVGEVVEDGEIVLDDDDVAVWTEERADQATSREALLHVQEGRGFVEHVAVLGMSHVRMDMVS